MNLRNPTDTHAPSIWRFLIVSITLALLAGCGDDGVAPTPVAGRFNLQTADGSPLPAVLFDGRVTADDGEFDLRIEIAGGYLEVNGGRYEQRITLHQWIDGIPSGPWPYRWTDRGDVTTLGAMLLFESTLIQNVAFFGVSEGNRISVTQDVLGPVTGEVQVTDLVFAR